MRRVLIGALSLIQMRQRLVKVHGNFEEKVPDAQVAPEKSGGFVPVRKNVEHHMHQSKLAAHEMSKTQFLVETFMMKLDDFVDGIAQHGLELDHFLSHDLGVRIAI